MHLLGPAQNAYADQQELNCYVIISFEGKSVLPGFMKTECFSQGMHSMGIDRVAQACRRTA